MRALACPAAIVLTGILFAVPAQAQPRIVRPSPLSQVMRNGWMRVSIVAGHITASGSPLGNINTSSTIDSRTERLSISASEGRPVVDYEVSSPDEQFALEIKRSNEVRIRRRTGRTAPPVEYLQAPGKPVALSIGADDHKQVYEAASLWHLLLEQPEVCRQHLVPALEKLRSDWALAQKAAEVEDELLRWAATGQVPDRPRWVALVAQLGDDRFAKRQAAERELRSGGPAVLRFLQQLDFEQLDPEQQFRVRRLLKLLTQEVEDDTPDQVASWITGDSSVWLALASRPLESTRRLAAAQLSRLLGEPIDFQPAADPDTRKRQIEQLRAKFPHPSS